MNWVLESAVFPRTHAALRRELSTHGHQIIDWRDEWWSAGLPSFLNQPTLFHGSLGNAARIKTDVTWAPGAYCDVSRFHSTAWCPLAARWLLNRDWISLTAAELVANAERVADEIGAGAEIFVRPDSPLKPFSGRKLRRDQITWRGLDFGYYYDDPALMVIVSTVKNILREWRYVVVNRTVIAGSAYEADGRIATADNPEGAPWKFAQDVAGDVPPPEDIFVIDVCESDGDLRLLELNPFSGADLYACDPNAVVESVSSWIE